MFDGIHNITKFTSINDAIDAFLTSDESYAMLSRDEHNKPLSKEILDRLTDDFCFFKDSDNSDESAKIFNDCILELVKNAYQTQLFGCI